jgi:hypothetical protein
MIGRDNLIFPTLRAFCKPRLAMGMLCLKTMPRKIIQIACIYDTGDDAWDDKPSEYRPHPILFGLADDGSCWMLRTPGESIGNAVRLLDSDAQTARRLSSIGGMPHLIRQTRTKG